MKKNVTIFGLVVGLLLTGFMLYGTITCYNDPEFKGNTVLGYAALLLAFSLIFVAIKNYRDKYNHGLISFGKAFRIGLYISLIASTIYVGVWLVEYYLFIPDFIDKYTIHVLKGVKDDGATAAEVAKKAQEMAEFKEMYKNPLFVILVSYMEVFPIGLVVSLIAAFILKRKPKRGPAVSGNQY